MKRTFTSLTVLIASLAGVLLMGGSARCETDDGSVATSTDDDGACADMYKTPCAAQSLCDNEDCTFEGANYWYDTETGEYHEHVFSDQLAADELAREETAETMVSECADMVDDEPAETDVSILVEDAATEQLRSQETADEYDNDDKYCCDIYGCEGYDCEGYAYEEDSEYAESDEQISQEDVAIDADEGEQSAEEYHAGYDECFWDCGDEPYIGEESTDLVEDTNDTPASETVEEIVDGPMSDEDQQQDAYEDYEYWYEYGYQEEVAAAESAADTSDCEKGELGTDQELESWVDAEIAKMIAASQQQNEQIASYEEGELGADVELECWVEVEFDQLIAASQPQEEEVISRQAILSLARTLDGMSATLKAVSRHLTEMAAPEVAERPVWIDESTQR